MPVCAKIPHAFSHFLFQHYTTKSEICKAICLLRCQISTRNGYIRKDYIHKGYIRKDKPDMADNMADNMACIADKHDNDYTQEHDDGDDNGYTQGRDALHDNVAVQHLLTQQTAHIPK